MHKVLSHPQKKQGIILILLFPCLSVRYSDDFNTNGKVFTERISNITGRLFSWNMSLHYCILSVIVQSLSVFNFKMATHDEVRLAEA